jgi:hypothetical protein
MYFTEKDDAVEDAGVQFAQSLSKASFNQSGQTNFFNFKIAREGINALQQQNPFTAGGLDQLMRNVESASVILDQSFQKMVNKMGMGANLATEIKQEFSEAAIDIIRLGGTETDALNTQLNTLDSMGRNVLLTSERMTEFYATTRATGLELPVLQKGFKDIGTSIYQIDNEMIKVIDTANRLGVSSKIVSKAVVENLQQLNRLGFENGIEGLAEMAAKSSALRTNMADVFKFADKVLSPESAIETAAALQRLGVTSSSLVDPLRLMDLAQNNVPELNEELGKMLKTYTYFDKQSQSFRIMPSARRDLKALEEAMGIPLDQLEKFALGAADLDKKMSEISFAGYGLDDETKELVANLSELGEGGEYKITTKDASGQLVEQSVTELLDAYKDNPTQLKEALMEAQGEEGKTAEEKMLSIAQQQLDMLTDMYKANEAAMKSPAFSMASGLGQELMRINQIGASKASEVIVNSLGPGSEFDKNIDESSKNLKEAADAFKKGDYSEIGPAIGKALLNVLQAGGSAFKDTIKEVGKQIPTDFEPLNDLQNFLKNQGIDLQNLQNVAPGLMNQVQNLFSQNSTNQNTQSNTNIQNLSQSQNLFSQNLNTQTNTSIQNLNQQTSDLGVGISNLNTDIDNLTTATNNLLMSSETLKTATDGFMTETVAMVTNSTVMNDYAQSLTTAIQNFYETSENLTSYVTNMNQNTNTTTNTFNQGPTVGQVGDVIGGVENNTTAFDNRMYSPTKVESQFTKFGDAVSNVSDNFLKFDQNFKDYAINNYGGTKFESNTLFPNSQIQYKNIDSLKGGVGNNTINSFEKNNELRFLSEKNELLRDREKYTELFSYREYQTPENQPLTAAYQPKKENDLLNRVMENNKSELFSSGNFNTNFNSSLTVDGGKPLRFETVIKFEGADRLSKDALSEFENKFRSTPYIQDFGNKLFGGMASYGINNTSPARPSGVQSNVNTGVGVNV